MRVVCTCIAYSVTSATPPPEASATPPPEEPSLGHVITEEAHDCMRVGLLSKVVDHITLLVEDWFVGVRPRTLVVPCPHCTANMPHKSVRINRSYSVTLELLPENERRERALSNPQEGASCCRDDSSHSAPYRSGLEAESSQAPSGHMTSQQELSQEPYAYAFRYNDCVVSARSVDSIFCPAHGDVPLQFMAPDTVS